MEMERYDYKAAVENDVRDYVEAEIDLSEWKGNRDGLDDKLNDDLWAHDSVTGNGSGSYTFNRWQAEEHLCHNLALLGEALLGFGCDVDYLMKNGAEACDVTIRCYLLSEAISNVLDEYEEKGVFDDEA